MTLFDIVILLIISGIAYQFWVIRSFSETANQYLDAYCRQNQLQLISIARKKSRIALIKGRVSWQSEFQFEFSATGQDHYIGFIVMDSKTIVQTYTPPYRINDNL